MGQPGVPKPPEMTVLLPRFVEVDEPEPPSLRELAQRHQLAAAGTRPRLGAYTRQLWRYRQFITAYANGRSVASFGTTRLGRLWQVLNPVINAGVYYLIFGVMLDTRDGVPNFIAYLCTGLFIFTFTQASYSPRLRRSAASWGWCGRCTSPGPACRSR